MVPSILHTTGWKEITEEEFLQRQQIKNKQMSKSPEISVKVGSSYREDYDKFKTDSVKTIPTMTVAN